MRFPAYPAPATRALGEAASIRLNPIPTYLGAHCSLPAPTLAPASTHATTARRMSINVYILHSQ